MNRVRRAAVARPVTIRFPVGALALAFAIIAAACGSIDTPTVGPASNVPSSRPSGSAAVARTVAPSPSNATPTKSPVASPSASPDSTGVASDAPSTEPGGACAGSADNRAFFANVARAVVWSVYCPTPVAGWFVAGQYRLGSGGRMDITYSGPGSMAIELHEGAFCVEPEACTPAGTEIAPAAFGDREGTLYGSSDGKFAIVVDAGKSPSWLAIGTALDEPTFRSMIAGLAVVGE